MESPLRLFLFGLNSTMIILFIFTLFSKVSLHAAGAGGLMGVMIGLKKMENIHWIPVIIIAMIIAFFIGYSRYKLNAHKPSEIYSGYCIGMLGVGLVYFVK